MSKSKLSKREKGETETLKGKRRSKNKGNISELKNKYDEKIGNYGIQTPEVD